MQDVVDEARRRFPTIGRVALVHRVGELELTESAVVVVVSAPHRPEAFDAARYCIDAVKQSVPIWKKEQWSSSGDSNNDSASNTASDTSSEWGTRAMPLVPASAVANESTVAS
jgi:molybdopterin synthase catalytic subunit